MGCSGAATDPEWAAPLIPVCSWGRCIVRGTRFKSPWVSLAFPVCACVEKKRQKRERVSKTLGRITPRAWGAGSSGKRLHWESSALVPLSEVLGTRGGVCSTWNVALCVRTLISAHFRFLRVNLSLPLLSSSNLKSKVVKSTLSAWWTPTHPSRTASWFVSYCSSPHCWS